MVTEIRNVASPGVEIVPGDLLASEGAVSTKCACEVVAFAAGTFKTRSRTEDLARGMVRPLTTTYRD